MKKVIGIILILIIMLVTLTGCTTKEKAIIKERFIRISRERFLGDTYIEILYDKETKVKYIYLDGYDSNAITALLDADGKPLLYEGE